LQVLITGATGLIGSALTRNLRESGYKIIALTRDPTKSAAIKEANIEYIKWDATTSSGWAKHVENSEVIINLAGANLADRLWTSEYKRVILDSRLYAGKAVLQAIMRAKNKPRLLIQASAIGFYGSSSDREIAETSGKGFGFLSDVCQQWENSTKMVENQGVDRIVARLGVVLSKDSKIVSNLRLPFRLFLGGHPGSGKQWFSWVHLDDVVSSFNFFIKRQDLKGIFNVCAPEPVQMKKYFEIYGNLLERPSWIHPPSFILKIILGDLAKEGILSSQRVLPMKLRKAGYKFKFSRINLALKNCLKWKS
jgi:uncharacterized protein (TIGR01777 family)